MSAELKDIKPPVEMVNIEVNGVPMQAPKGSMIIEATDKAGISIPRFCYHRKLSIAANCRMCLVDVEKAPKPLPACATPVMDGMKVYTESRRAIDAQHGVMEFLLINHPLDCPICDQGGECELQDLAMGYGRSVSRFTERKRVVKDKNVGPLVQTDMTRCIHCTRCIRFLEEIAGTSEMGGAGRGDRLEIGTCVENSINSELSGNIIDLCPVGALTNKPFRFAARAWELVAHATVSPHDGIGSTLFHHARNGRILRSVPRDNEACNETWLADRDRYSCHGLYHADRLLQPQVKQDGVWHEVSWDKAFARVSQLLRAASDAGAGQVQALMSPSATTEEYFLAQRLVRALGSEAIDHRLRECDFSDDAARPLAPVFEMPLTAIEQADAVLMLGCNPRHEAPLLGHRLRKAWLAGGRISAINPLDWEFVFELSVQRIVPPAALQHELAAVAAATAQITGASIPDHLHERVQASEPGEIHKRMAQQMIDGRRSLVLLGQFAMAHPQASLLRALSRWIADTTGSALNLVTHGANAVGAWRAGAVPHRGPGGRARPGSPASPGLPLSSACAASILWDVEPAFDCADPQQAQQSLQASQSVIVVASFAGESLRSVADVLLPLSPWAESFGSSCNFDGKEQVFSPAGRPQGEARPGWKILRRLGESLGLEGFAQVSLTELQEEMRATCDGQVESSPPQVRGVDDADPATPGLQRIGELAMYSVDALCRRSAPLQQTEQGAAGWVGLNPADAERLGLQDGGKARVRQGDLSCPAQIRVTTRVPAGSAWLQSGTSLSASLGAASGRVSVEVA